MIGKTIAQYRIVEQLGRGAMGVVYRAIDEALGREVAIKVLHAERANAQLTALFRAEAGAIARLNHPAIATVYELFRENSDLLMVMEFVRGETLEQVCARSGPVTVHDTTYYIDQVLWGLEHAHRAGVVHCDIKPANIMVSGDGAIKITDFGTARVCGDEGSAASHLMGTPAYMAPEQLLGQTVDGRADLYAVGVVFYRLLTGSLPFVADTTLAMARKQLSERPAPLRLHCERVPDWCELVVQRALAKAPRERFRTADQFRDALRVAAGWTTVAPARPLAMSPGNATTASHFDADLSSWVTAGTRPNRFALNRARAEIAALAVLAPVVIAALLYTTSIPEPVGIAPPPPPIATIEPLLPTPLPSGRRSGPAVPDVFGAPASTRESDQHEVMNRSKRSTEDAPANVAVAEASAPLAFEARLLERNGANAEVRACEVALTNDAITIRDAKQRDLRVVPYSRVISIGYSHGRDPLWRSPNGPMPVAHVSRGLFGFFNGGRHWLTLRTRSADQELIALQFGTDQDAVRAMAALQARTGRRPERIGLESRPDEPSSHVGLALRDDMWSPRR